MQATVRTAKCSATRAQRVLWRQHQRRHASQGPDLQPQQPAGPSSPNESFGRGFYIAILCIPAGIGLYTISQPSKDGQDPYFTQLIKTAYKDYAASNATRNDLHTKAIEQAAADRTLFLNDPGQYHKRVDHRFPESMNAGSPFNVPAGHGYANIDAMVAKYQKESFEMNEKKLRQLRENRIPSEQPFVPDFTKGTPAAADS